MTEIMKIRQILLTALATLSLVSCVDDKFHYGGSSALKGTLSLSGMDIDYSEEMTTPTKAEAADGNYMLYIYNSSEELVWSGTYGSVKQDGQEGISLLAGDYRLDVRSSSSGVPDAKFSTPVYGVSEAFSIEAGKTTSIGTLTCTLLQSAVSVRYNDDFLAMVTGDGKSTVEVASGFPLEYVLNYNDGRPKYEQRIGYFAVNGENSTMTVTFKGGIEGKNQKMTTTITGIKARDYHIVTFMKKVDESGNVSVGIEIDGLVADVELDNDAQGEESGDGNDPDAPVGDGGIALVSTCEYNISNPVNVPAVGKPFSFTMKAQVPNGTLKFTVDIESTNKDFINSVNTVGGTKLDLINPSEAAMGIFDIVPFPHGAELLGKTEILFDLSNAQAPLRGFAGTHTFTMNVVDKKGCKKSIPIVLVVK